MTPTISESRSRQAWDLTRRQHGVLTRRDLLSLGFSDEAIQHRLKRGRLHRIVPGVYAVGRRRLNREGRWMAAVLACGPGAALSHRSAAALWKFGKEHEDYIDVSVLRDSEARIRREVIDPESLREALRDHAGEPGVRPLRRILDKHTFRLSDDELELLFRPLAADAGLPTPLTKVIVNEFEVDFFWSDLGLVVETDGWRYHRTPATQTRDALRFQTHTAAGLTPLRFSHWQVKYEPHHVLNILRSTAAHLRGSLHPH